MNIKLRKYYPLTIAFLLLAFLYGCSTWKNFSAYFNRFYIAEKAFDLAMEDIKENNPRPLFQFKEQKLSSVANKNFDDVIKYASKILQFNKDTKYVAESIYMIAVSYYYKGQYSKALRKFAELEKLNIPDYKYLTILWIAKSEMQMRSFSSALARIDEIKAASDVVDEELLFEAYVTEIRYLIYREEYSKAILAIEELLRQDLDDVTKSEVTYELGMLYESLENYEKAVNAFQFVWEGEPTFVIEFKSKLEYAKCVKHLNREEEALEVLYDLRNDTKYEEHWDLVDIEIAQIELESGNVQDALDIFYSVDTGYARNESSGIAAFMQGDIMEHIFMDFDSAKILYDKVLSKKVPPEYKKDAQEKVKVLKLRKDYLDNIISSKRGYVYLQDTLLFKQDSIAYAGYLSRRDSAMKAAEELKGNEETRTTGRRRSRGRTTRGTAQALAKKFKYKEDSLFTYKPKMPLISEDSLRAKIAMNEYKLGNLYLGELEVPDSAYFYYNDIITNFPNTPYHARTLYALGSYYLTIDKKEKADSLFRYVYDNFSSEPIAKAAAVRLGITVQENKFDPAADKYSVAEDKIELGEYYDAIEDLDSVYTAYPESQYAPKALYAVGWIYENKLSDYDMAVNYYDSLLAHYPKTEYAREVRTKVSFYHTTIKAREDSIARAQKAIEDSIKVADSLAQVSSLSDSALVADSASVLSDTTGLPDAKSVGVKDSLNSKSTKQDSAKAANLFKEAAKHTKKPKASTPQKIVK